MEELARQKVTDIHDLNAILRLTDFGKLGGKIWKILYELNSSPQLKARIVMPGKYILKLLRVRFNKRNIILIFVFKTKHPNHYESEKTIFASALLFAACGTIQAQEVIAHRGFWTTDGSAQNSLAALVKADSIHCYGSEFDVWLTTDNQLVVNHDATFKGVTMQDATAKVCTAVQLDNGEQLPTLQQYLDKAKA